MTKPQGNPEDWPVEDPGPEGPFEGRDPEEAAEDAPEPSESSRRDQRRR